MVDVGLKPGMKQLAQITPANTTTISAIKKERRSNLIVAYVVVCNTTGSDAEFSVFVDNNGTTYNDTTALFANNVVNAKSTTVLDFSHAGLPLNVDVAAGNLAVKSNTNSAITFSIYGIETR